MRNAIDNENKVLVALKKALVRAGIVSFWAVFAHPMDCHPCDGRNHWYLFWTFGSRRGSGYKRAMSHLKGYCDAHDVTYNLIYERYHD